MLGSTEDVLPKQVLAPPPPAPKSQISVDGSLGSPLALAQSIPRSSGAVPPSLLSSRKQVRGISRQLPLCLGSHPRPQNHRLLALRSYESL